jgi:hypothetical protein
MSLLSCRTAERLLLDMHVKERVELHGHDVFRVSQRYWSVDGAEPVRLLTAIGAIFGPSVRDEKQDLEWLTKD